MHVNGKSVSMCRWQSVEVFGNEKDNHTINFSLLHKLQEKLTDIYCMRSSLNTSQRKRGSTRRNKNGLLQPCSFGVKEYNLFHLNTIKKKIYFYDNKVV